MTKSKQKLINEQRDTISDLRGTVKRLQQKVKQLMVYKEIVVNKGYAKVVNNEPI